MNAGVRVFDDTVLESAAPIGKESEMVPAGRVIPGEQDFLLQCADGIQCAEDVQAYRRDRNGQ